jgi:hypothetical protein
MKYVLAVLALLATKPAYAECFPAKVVIRALLVQEFIPVGEFEHDHKPAMIFVNPGGAYRIVSYFDEKTLCIIGGGSAFYLFRERKA